MYTSFQGTFVNYLKKIQTEKRIIHLLEAILIIAVEN